MKARDEKEETPIKTGAPGVRRIYEKPAVTELGDVRELTLGPGIGTKIDFNGMKRP